MTLRGLVHREWVEGLEMGLGTVDRTQARPTYLRGRNRRRSRSYGDGTPRPTISQVRTGAVEHAVQGKLNPTRTGERLASST